MGHIVLGVTEVQQAGSRMRKTLEPSRLPPYAILSLVTTVGLNTVPPASPCHGGISSPRGDELDSKIEYISAQAREMNGDGPAWLLGNALLNVFSFCILLLMSRAERRPGQTAAAMGMKPKAQAERKMIPAWFAFLNVVLCHRRAVSGKDRGYPQRSVTGRI